MASVAARILPAMGRQMSRSVAAQVVKQSGEFLTLIALHKQFRAN